jgi:alanine dehydrogenase
MKYIDLLNFQEKMKIGCIKEIKKHEYRVGLTPSDVRQYKVHGHQIYLEKNAGTGAGFDDLSYKNEGAIICDSREEIFSLSEMIIKVKEPLPEEYDLFKEEQILYTYLHLAANEELTNELMQRKIKAVAYETIENSEGQLPCLKPMSEIAGRLAVQEGAKYLEKTFGGRGILLGGVPGITRGKVCILGGGIVGINACKIASGMGADVTILDINASRLAYLDDIFGSRITTLYSTAANIDKVLHESDVLIGAVLLPGAKAPVLVKKEQVKSMKTGSVIVDVAIDQGGCIETIHPTTHDDPVYMVDGVVHYGVTNMPGAVALSSTLALTSTTLPYGLMIADIGLEEACRKSEEIYKGVNIYKGKCVYENVARAFHIGYTELKKLI